MTLDLAWQVVAILVAAMIWAGIVRGFTGFGDALIFIPIASLFLPPILSISLLMVAGILGPIPMLRGAIKDADRNVLLYVNVPMALSIPLGFYIATILPAEYLRVAISVLAIAVSVLMVVGWKPSFGLSARNLIILGLACGLVGGATGVPGAFLIFFFLNVALRVSSIRANVTLTLIIFDIVLITFALLSGEVDVKHLSLALILVPANILGNWLGKTLFNPDKEKLFRRIGLLAIFASGLIGMPYALFF